MVERVLKPRVLTSAEKLGERSMLLPEGEFVCLWPKETVLELIWELPL